MNNFGLSRGCDVLLKRAEELRQIAHVLCGAVDEIHREIVALRIEAEKERDAANRRV